MLCLTCKKPLFINNHLDMKNTLFIICLSLLLYSCEKTVKETEYKDITYSWSQDSLFQYDNSIIMNSHSTNEVMYFLGFYNFTKMPITSALSPSTLKSKIITYKTPFDYPVNCKFPITDKYFIAADANNKSVVFAANNSPHNSHSTHYQYMKDVDSLFTQFDFIHYSQGECIPVTKSNFCLIPYRTKYETSLPKFALIKINLKDVGGDLSIDTKVVKVLDLKSDVEGYQTIYSISSVGDKFLFSCGRTTYQVDTVGLIKNVYSGVIERFINSNNILYGVTWPFNSKNFIKSVDNGSSWTEISSIKQEFSDLNYKTVFDSIVGYYNSQLFSIKFSDTHISSRELDNNGLEGKRITSISEFGDSLVYITTMNGLYYRTKKDFFSSKIKK